MQIFEENDKTEVKITCKVCMEEIKYFITEEEYKNTVKFPIRKENIHGVPKHNLIVFLNRNLEIDNFKVKEILDTEVNYSKELTRQVLSEIDLSEEEIRLFFLTTGRDVVSLGEIALLLEKSKEESQQIAKKFVDKGLYKEVIGATPHYSALPPYAALLSQLKNFHSYISTIEKEIPPQLSKSFSEIESQAEGVKDLKDYTNFMLDLKENVLSKIQSQKDSIESTITGIETIKNLSKVISNLESNATQLMEEQIRDIKTQFGLINNRISDSMNKQIANLTTNFDKMNDRIAEITKQQLDQLANQLENVMARVSENLKKLHLGVVQKTVEKVINNVFKGWLKDMTHSFNQQLTEFEQNTSKGVSQTVESLNNQLSEVEVVSKEALETTTTNFNTKLIGNLKKSIDTTVNEINQVTRSTSQSAEYIKEIFGSISEDFSNAVSLAGDKIMGISDNILHSFKELQETFSTQVLFTLEYVLKKIMERLEVSEITTTEFWDQAKKASLFTVKDIWFIRSIESAKAYVREELNNAKMRVLIVTPEISDIDVLAIKQRPRHINIRIASYIDVRNSEHVMILNQLDQLPNVAYRHRELRNMWAMSRDYEQIILCVVSTTEAKSNVITEIAGIGSIIPEHIKILVPILEDAWIGARKLVDSYNVIEEVKATPSRQQILTTPGTSMKRQKLIKTQTYTEPKTEKVAVSPNIQKPVENVKQKPSLKPVTPLKKSSLSVSDILKTKKQASPKEEESTPVSPLSTPKTSEPIKQQASPGKISSKAALSNYIDFLKQQVSNITAQVLSEKLLYLAESIEMVLGYSRVLDPIKKASTEMSVKSGLLKKRDKKLILKRINFWKDKLNL